MKATGQEPLKHERNRDIGHEGLHSGERYFGGRVPFGRGVQGSNHDYKVLCEARPLTTKLRKTTAFYVVAYPWSTLVQLE